MPPQASGAEAGLEPVCASGAVVLLPVEAALVLLSRQRILA